MRVLVFGAGVIGRIYAGRLVAAGYEVSMVCRGSAASEIAVKGIVLRRGGQLAEAVHPQVFLSASNAGSFDLAVIAIRRDQVTAALPMLRQIRAATILSLIDLPIGLDELSEAVGRDRFVPGFPGVAGALGADGVVDYLEVAQQPTTVGVAPQTPTILALLASAGFATATSADMESWLMTHAVFVSAFESSIVLCGGDVANLSGDAVAMRGLVLAVREGFEGLHAINMSVLPSAVRLIFMTMPVWFATRYWSRALAGPLGALGMAPHSLASRGTELPALQRDVKEILRGQKTPRLDALFAAGAAAAAVR